jgi:hypothetical protein
MSLFHFPRSAAGDLSETHKVDADNQLGFTPTVALDLGGIGAAGPGVRLLLAAHGRALALGTRRRVSRGAAGISRRTAHGRRRPLLDRRGVSGHGWRAGVDGRRSSDHLAGRGTGRALVDERAGATDEGRRSSAGREVGRVAGRAIAGAGMIHGETGGGRRGDRGSRSK